MRASVFLAVPAFAVAVFAQSVRLKFTFQPLTTIALNFDVFLTSAAITILTRLHVSALVLASVVVVVGFLLLTH